MAEPEWVSTEREQFRQFDIRYTALMLAEVAKIEKLTGCLKPCSYNEYKFVNYIPKDIMAKDIPDDKIAIGLWAVSEETQFEDEVFQ